MLAAHWRARDLRLHLREPIQVALGDEVASAELLRQADQGYEEIAAPNRQQIRSNNQKLPLDQTRHFNPGPFYSKFSQF